MNIKKILITLITIGFIVCLNNGKCFHYPTSAAIIFHNGSIFIINQYDKVIAQVKTDDVFGISHKELTKL